MLEETKKYILEKFGRMHPVFEHMDKYSPDIVDGFIKIEEVERSNTYLILERVKEDTTVQL